ncbi:hypothetical protein [Stenotrophomonas maltophilia]|uniref:hypothetical protein n=1 Tax=Stenotrophomonas maltophilia TaxID=40324 RepID=UPI0021C5CDBF|nr:hypothetical protein [Stenotrophomonas maltophilia]MCU1064975.1 hypothetical protein [Stenotrophomonas maltophilia]HDS1531620.1 hypothetical protein [Stenotrophomonas maltophilia]
MQNMHRQGLCFVALELGMPITALQLVMRGDSPAAAAQLLACSRADVRTHSP